MEDVEAASPLSEATNQLFRQYLSLVRKVGGPRVILGRESLLCLDQETLYGGRGFLLPRGQLLLVDLCQGLLEGLNPVVGLSS